MSDVKLCKDCAHLLSGRRCALATVLVGGIHHLDVVAGGKATSTGSFAESMRQVGAPCGPSADLFEPKESEEEALLLRAWENGERAAAAADGCHSFRAVRLAFSRAFVRTLRDRAFNLQNSNRTYPGHPQHTWGDVLHAMLDKLIGEE